MKLTKNEQYLLKVIATIRGNACDSAGRLNSIALGKESPETAANKEEVQELIEQLRSPEYGAGLPWWEPDKYIDESAQAKILHEMAEKFL